MFNLVPIFKQNIYHAQSPDSDMEITVLGYINTMNAPEMKLIRHIVVNMMLFYQKPFVI